MDDFTIVFGNKLWSFGLFNRELMQSLAGISKSSRIATQCPTSNNSEVVQESHYYELPILTQQYRKTIQVIRGMVIICRTSPSTLSVIRWVDTHHLMIYHFDDQLQGNQFTGASGEHQNLVVTPRQAWMQTPSCLRHSRRGIRAGLGSHLIRYCTYLLNLLTFPQL